MVNTKFFIEVEICLLGKESTFVYLTSDNKTDLDEFVKDYSPVISGLDAIRLEQSRFLTVNKQILSMDEVNSKCELHKQNETLFFVFGERSSFMKFKRNLLTVYAILKNQDYPRNAVDKLGRALSGPDWFVNAIDSKEVKSLVSVDITFEQELIFPIKGCASGVQVMVFLLPVSDFHLIKDFSFRCELPNVRLMSVYTSSCELQEALNLHEDYFDSRQILGLTGDIVVTRCYDFVKANKFLDLLISMSRGFSPKENLLSHVSDFIDYPGCVTVVSRFNSGDETGGIGYVL